MPAATTNNTAIVNMPTLENPDRWEEPHKVQVSALECACVLGGRAGRGAPASASLGVTMPGMRRSVVTNTITTSLGATFLTNMKKAAHTTKTVYHPCHFSSCHASTCAPCVLCVRVRVVRASVACSHSTAMWDGHLRCAEGRG